MGQLLSTEPATWSAVAGDEPIDTLVHGSQRLATHLGDFPDLLHGVGAQRVLLVVDRAAVKAAQLEEPLREALSGLAVTSFDQFTSNPRLEDGLAAAKSRDDFSADTVLAIGGGSCLDVAKFAALNRSNSNESISQMLESLAVTSAIPIVAVPTTSGSGSEATHFAVLYHEKRKISLANPAMRPAAVLLDPRFHVAMPPKLAAVTGLDALSQSLESIWAVGATEDSLRIAELAAHLIADSLERSVIHGEPEARLKMMIGAHLAGQAINISKTTAAHALSYELSTNLGVPHGHAVALTLGWVGAINHGVGEHDCIDPRGPSDVRDRVGRAAAVLGAGPAELPSEIHSLLVRLRLPATLAEAGVAADNIANLAAAVDAVRLSNNPRRLSHGQIKDLLQSALTAPGERAN